MGRSWLRILCLAAGVSAVGCTNYGSYTVAWEFVGGDVDSASADCGLHGVDSIRLIGTSSEGESENVAAVCPAGKLTHSVPVGTWTFAVHQLDVRGGLIDMMDANGDPVVPMAAAVVKEDGDPVVLDPSPVVLTPRPVCNDGVDNDRDGRVDADDPVCVADPNSATE